MERRKLCHEKEDFIKVCASILYSICAEDREILTSLNLSGTSVVVHMQFYTIHYAL